MTDGRIAYSIRDAAQAAGVSEGRIREWIADGRLTRRLNGSRVLILADELRAVIESLPTDRTA